MQSEPETLPSEPIYPHHEPVRASSRTRWGLHLGLFLATFVTATWVQSLDFSHATDWRELLLTPLHNPAQLRQGLVFAVTLLAILLAHEMGHYLVARYYRVDQSLPYFIPAPTLFGTLGAVILMRSRPPDRRVLLRVAVAGPFAGMALALPAAIWGLMHSVGIAAAPRGNETLLGGSLLWGWLVQALVPTVGQFVDLHPVALGAWAGMLVTALNLIPAAQLDGGHVAYALFGARQATLSRLVVVLLLGLGVLLGATGAGSVWLIWAVLLTFFGLRHPPVQDEAMPLSHRDRVAGYAALVLFVLTFVPVPVVQEPQVFGGAPASVDLQTVPDRPELSTHGAEEFRL